MLLISPMGGEDIAEVAELDRETGSSWAILHFEQQLASPYAFHYTIRHPPDHKLYGFICGQCVSQEAEIHKIVVPRPYRRKHVGSTLLNHTLHELRTQQATSCFLELRASNTSALQLYHSFNFQTVGRRKKYYTAPSEDAIIMELTPMPLDQNSRLTPLFR